MAALTLNSRLTDLAVLKSRDMRDNNYISHTSPIYGTPQQMLDRFGVSWRAYGEKIVAGQATPEEVMRVWINIPLSHHLPHRNVSLVLLLLQNSS
ncbi:CAP domain-containing protein [Paenibacillus segetis]|uniref:CAP domain-containing protein n=1 Tax=Paenibacillus segetis TaxID=1325360 RepID=UPI0027E448E2|nr:CAP domain-containing protein [Paenibacillus segetis]